MQFENSTRQQVKATTIAGYKCYVSADAIFFESLVEACKRYTSSWKSQNSFQKSLLGCDQRSYCIQCKLKCVSFSLETRVIYTALDDASDHPVSTNAIYFESLVLLRKTTSIWKPEQFARVPRGNFRMRMATKGKLRLERIFQKPYKVVISHRTIQNSILIRHRCKPNNNDFQRCRGVFVCQRPMKITITIVVQAEGEQSRRQGSISLTSQ